MATVEGFNLLVRLVDGREPMRVAVGVDNARQARICGPRCPTASLDGPHHLMGVELHHRAARVRVYVAGGQNKFAPTGNLLTKKPAKGRIKADAAGCRPQARVKLLLRLSWNHIGANG